MSGSGRAVEFLTAWREGYRAEHTAHAWGEECTRRLADAFDLWEGQESASFRRLTEVVGDTPR